MRPRRFVALLAAASVLLVLACSGGGAWAQEQQQEEDAKSSSSIVPPMPIPPRRSNAINVNATSSSRGASKAIADCPENANGTLTVVGTGHAAGAPDVARIRMTVEALAPTAAEARSQAAETTQAVMDSLKQFSGAETRSMSVSVHAQRDTRNGVTKTTGFQFRQSLAVTLVSPGSDNSKQKNAKNDTSTSTDTLASLASRALDAAIAAGGDRISVDNLEFEMNPERQSQAVVEARSRALVDLREKAERDASNLGLQLGALMSVKVNPYPRTGEPRAMRSSAAMASGAEGQHKGPSTPLSSPDAETEVSAEGVYRVCSPS